MIEIAAPKQSGGQQSRMDNGADKICRYCRGGQGVSQLSPPESMQRTEPPIGLWQDTATYLMGTLPTGESFLVIVDY